MATPPGSVVITCRERFSTSVESLRSVLSTVPHGSQVIFVDAGSPPSISAELAQVAKSHDILLLRTDDFLSPNAARNLAFGYVEHDFVAFVDNDVVFPPGWLERLIECAQDTGAWLVSPVIIQEGTYGRVIHMVGGDCGIRTDDGTRRFRECHVLMGHPLDEMPALSRQPTGLVEFHCVLVSRPAYDACFPLDEELRSARDHCDLALGVQHAGGATWLEPSVAVTQLAMPDRLPRVDRRWYALRWSNAWNRISLRRFREKWDLDPADPMDEHDFLWLSVHRLYGNRAYGGLAGALPSRPRRVAIRVADRGTQTLIDLTRRTGSRRTSMPRVVHAPEPVAAQSE